LRNATYRCKSLKSCGNGLCCIGSIEGGTQLTALNGLGLLPRRFLRSINDNLATPIAFNNANASNTYDGNLADQRELLI
jgi:hypothetical protein